MLIHLVRVRQNRCNHKSPPLLLRVSSLFVFCRLKWLWGPSDPLISILHLNCVLSICVFVCIFAHMSLCTLVFVFVDANPLLLLPGANDRYLDNRLFAHEVRMNKLLRNKDHAEQIVSDVRTAVNSLIHLMTINHKLMYALPRSEPPQIKTNDDIAGGI